jgi:hypothetical protein
VNNAAGKVSAVLVIGQSAEANCARLRRKFVTTYGAEPPEGKTWADVVEELKTN